MGKTVNRGGNCQLWYILEEGRAAGIFYSPFTLGLNIAAGSTTME